MYKYFIELVLKYKGAFIKEEYFDEDWFFDFCLDIREYYPEIRDIKEYIINEMVINPRFIIEFNPVVMKKDFDNIVKGFTENEKIFFKEYLRKFL